MAKIPFVPKDVPIPGGEKGKTILVVILLGVGFLLVASSLDCTPIIDTFQKIIGRQTDLIDWSGNKSTNPCKGTGGASVASIGGNQPPIDVCTGKIQCPPGQVPVGVAGVGCVCVNTCPPGFQWSQSGGCQPKLF